MLLQNQRGFILGIFDSVVRNFCSFGNSIFTPLFGIYFSSNFLKVFLFLTIISLDEYTWVLGFEVVEEDKHGYIMTNMI
jgi:hypothetical protein